MINLNDLDDTVIFGTFNGLAALGFGRLYGIHLNPEILEIGQNASLQNGLNNPGDQIIFFKNFFPRGLKPFRVLGAIYHHRDNSGRLGFFGVGKVVPEKGAYVDVLTLAISLAKCFDTSRMTRWEETYAQFQNFRANMRPGSNSFDPSIKTKDVILCVSDIREIWEGLLRLSTNIQVIDRTDIYFVDDPYRDFATSPSEFLEFLSASFSADKRSLAHEYEIEKQKLIAQYQQSGIPSQANLTIRLSELYAAQQKNLQFIESIMLETNKGNYNPAHSSDGLNHYTESQASSSLDIPNQHRTGTSESQKKLRNRSVSLPHQTAQQSTSAPRLGIEHLKAEQSKARRFRYFLILCAAVLLIIVTAVAVGVWFF